MEDAPDPVIPTLKPKDDLVVEKEKKKENEILEKKVFSINKNDEKYSLNISSTKNDTILFQLNIDQEFFTSYYEEIYKVNHLSNIEAIFKYFDTLKDSYLFITENIKNNISSVNIQFNEDKAKLNFDAVLNFGKKLNIEFVLNKKEIKIDSILKRINNKIINNNENQNKLDEKIKEIKDLLSKKTNIENEINSKLNELQNKIKENQNNSEKTDKENKNKIEVISKKQEKILINLEKIDRK